MSRNSTIPTILYLRGLLKGKVEEYNRFHTKYQLQGSFKFTTGVTQIRNQHFLHSSPCSYFVKASVSHGFLKQFLISPA